jgi:hypothetical protein
VSSSFSVVGLPGIVLVIAQRGGAAHVVIICRGGAVSHFVLVFVRWATVVGCLVDKEDGGMYLELSRPKMSGRVLHEVRGEVALHTADQVVVLCVLALAI